MLNIEDLSKQLFDEEKQKRMKEIAASPEGKKIAELLDASQVKKAAADGDTQSLQKILAQVLSTEEGKKLAEQVSKAMNKN
jgi:hypothetical protein